MALFIKVAFFFFFLQFIVCETFNEQYLEIQYYIKNYGGDDLIEGLDHNIYGVLVNESLSGEGVVSKFVGYGIYHHNETDGNMLFQHSYNYLPGENSSDPYVNFREGYSCIDLVGNVASAKNGECILGIAYNSKFVVRKVRRFGKIANESLIAEAIWDNSTFDRSNTSISILSLMPENSDQTIYYIKPFKLIQEAISNATQFGRNGRGTIFVSFSGIQFYANQLPIAKIRQVIVVVPISCEGTSQLRPSIDLKNILVAGVVGSNNRKIPSPGVDVNHDQACTSTYNQESATSDIAGIVALVFEANPNLNWLDVQYLLVKSARYDKLKKYPFTYNGKNLKWSSYYGFGVPDAQIFVDTAKNWNSFPKEEKSVSLEKSFDQKQIHYSNTTEVCFNVTNSLLTVFQAQIEISLTHAAISLIQIILQSPYKQDISLTSYNLENSHSFDNYPFTTRFFFGERSDGLWKVKIINNHETFTPLLSNLKLSLFGISVLDDPDPAPLPPDPTPTPSSSPSSSPSPSPSTAPSTAPTVSPAPFISNETIVIRFSSTNVIHQNAIYLFSFFILISIFL
ncbi:neuroendocrine convertase [Anaeramoeba flamelloides]|uniref:Neuroendocrine convertase n=1 Tax=Anaeramoeba flamelloides TaxID=1746091 RepID=A0AAV7ZVN3_9EUKA|nr:neuroendocrine convertase [Anaeramoeba flamelloides]